jgi:hypothetical protein
MKTKLLLLSLMFVLFLSCEKTGEDDTPIIEIPSILQLNFWVLDGDHYQKSKTVVVGEELNFRIVASALDSTSKHLSRIYVARTFEKDLFQDTIILLDTLLNCPDVKYINLKTFANEWVGQEKFFAIAYDEKNKILTDHIDIQTEPDGKKY